MIINGGIVTYNPDIEKLKKNISRIAGQVCKLVIADNGSKNIEDIKRLAAAFENVSVILNYENFGIARALNQIMKWSSNNGGDWTITLDQDSECSDCIIDLYKPYLATVYKGNIIKNLIMDCQSYTKYRPNETTGGIFVSWRRKEELPTGA